MFFCPKCNNIFDITQTLSKLQSRVVTEKKDLQQKGGDISVVVGGDPQRRKSSFGGDRYTTIINTILEKKPIKYNDIKDISITGLYKHPHYKKQKTADKTYIRNKIQDLLPKKSKKINLEKDIEEQRAKNIAYFQCTNCGYTTKIKPGTLIYSKTTGGKTSKSLTYNVSDMIYDNTLPRTRKYICQNKKCISHKHPEKKEAIFFRTDNTYEITYICTLCKEIF